MNIKKPLSLIALSLLVVFMFGCKERTQSVEALLADMITEYGGEENLKKLDSYASLWKIKVQVREQEGKAVNSVQMPDKLRVELIYPDRTELRVVNGSKGYKGFNGGAAQEVSGPQLDSMKLQLMRLYTPLELKRRMARLQLSEGDGVKLITLKEGELTVVYHVNPTTKRIDKVVGKLDMGGRQMEFVTEYSDYKLVDGVLIHHKENKFAAGTNTAILYLKGLKLGATHNSKIFF
jgi:hypothetical protein